MCRGRVCRSCSHNRSCTPGSSPSDQGPVIPAGDLIVNPIARALRRLASQDVARDNAAGAAAEIQQRLKQHQEVEDYLARQTRTSAPARG